MRILDLSHEIIPFFFDDKSKLSNVDIRSVFCHFFKPDPETEWHIAHLFSTSTHCGTHLESPYHWKKDGKDIAALPLESLVGSAIKLNFSYKKTNEPISYEEVRHQSKGKLRRGDMVFLQTDHSRFWGREEYWLDSPSLSQQAAKWLVSREVKLIGIDAPRLDCYRSKGRERYVIHEILHKNDVLVIENMANLQMFKNRGTAFVLPVKIRGLDAFPVRVIVIEEGNLK
ncbi:MAG: cyclase family protein [Candidatus Bathyarchaeia archaeon]